MTDVTNPDLGVAVTEAAGEITLADPLAGWVVGEALPLDGKADPSRMGSVAIVIFLSGGKLDATSLIAVSIGGCEDEVEGERVRELGEVEAFKDPVDADEGFCVGAGFVGEAGLLLGAGFTDEAGRLLGTALLGLGFFASGFPFPFFGSLASTTGNLLRRRFAGSRSALGMSLNLPFSTEKACKYQPQARRA